MNEKWLDIAEYEGLYQISSLGRVKSLRNNKILKPSLTTKKEYLGVSLCKDGKVKRFVIHRLVAKMFIDNPNNYCCVNHKDQNKTNNCVENLEWCTASYNVKYSKKNIKKVCQYDMNDNLIKMWDSSYQAKKELKLKSARSIDQCCKGTRKTTYGYKWSYEEDD